MNTQITQDTVLNKEVHNEVKSILTDYINQEKVGTSAHLFFYKLIKQLNYCLATKKVEGNYIKGKLTTTEREFNFGDDELSSLFSFLKTKKINHNLLKQKILDGFINLNVSFERKDEVKFVQGVLWIKKTSGMGKTGGSWVYQIKDVENPIIPIELYEFV